MKLLKTLVVVALACCLSAQAALIVYEGVDPYKIVNITMQGGYNGPVYAGVDKLTVDGLPVDAFCVDLWNAAVHTPLQYQVRPVEDVFGPNKAYVMQSLWSVGYHENMTAEEAAALQVSFWTVVASDHNFAYSGVGGVDALFVASRARSGDLPDLVVYTSPIGQDFVSIVPEPASWATIAVAGLGGFVFYRRIRRD